MQIGTRKAILWAVAILGVAVLTITCSSGGPNIAASGTGGVTGSGGASSGTGGMNPGTGGASTPTLSLLAGGLGGPGNVDGTGVAARFTGPDGVVGDGAGNVFVATFGDDAIRKVEIATGIVTTLAGSPGAQGNTDGTGAAVRFSAAHGLATDGAGNLFVADLANDTIRKVVIATGVVTTLAGSPGVFGSTDGTGADARFSAPVGLATDGEGNLFVADVGNDTIRKVVIATGVVTTLAGSAGVSGSTDGSGADARFSAPVGLATDGAGNLFVAEAGNDTIRKVVIATGVVTTLAGTPGVSGTTDGTGADARFFRPEGLASDGAGNLFVTDVGNDTIRKVEIATGVVTTLAGASGLLGADDERFYPRQGLASDRAGNLFVADRHTVAILRVEIATGVVTTLAGSPGIPGNTDGMGATARFAGPDGLASDGAGNLFVADVGNDTIRKVVIATGVVTTLAGSPGISGSTDGTGADARFYLPVGLATDGEGNLFVAEAGNDTIRKVVIATGVVTTLAGSGASPARGGTNVTGGASPFAVPHGLATDGAGNLFVADLGNHTIRRVVIATGVVTTLAGSPGVSGNADGTGADARFASPEGLATDGTGNLFVAELGSDTIRKVEIATGVVTTLAGAPRISGLIDASRPVARFAVGLASDGAGSLFVTDADNYTIRKVVIATGVVTTLVGSPGRVGVTLGPLAAGLNAPRGLAFGPAGSLFISDENAVLEVH